MLYVSHWYSNVSVAIVVVELYQFQQLIGNLDRDLQYAIRVEGKMDLDSITNYEDVKKAIMDKVIFCLS